VAARTLFVAGLGKGMPTFPYSGRSGFVHGLRRMGLGMPYFICFFLAALTLAFGAPAAAQRSSRYDPIIVLEPDSELLRQSEGMLFVDRELIPAGAGTHELLDGLDSGLGSPRDLLAPMHHLYTDLRRGLQRYLMEYGSLPELEIPAGPALRQGQSGDRVALLRERLGLEPGDAFDADLAAAVKAWQEVHGLGADGIAGAATIASLNLGARHYERIILVNLDRARQLPADEWPRYVLVDAGAARLWLYEDGRAVDTMRTIVGNAGQPTPMMAALVRYAEVNPYWNVPPDFVQNRMAQRIIGEGSSYLRDRRYEVLADWTEAAAPVDPDTIDWQAVAAGSVQPRIRQLPGANNSMGEIKFMMPNELGIYLHDTPDKSLFDKDDRWISNGCIRVQDARRLAAWLFGEMPQAEPRDRMQRVDLENPVPVYVTYLTVETGEDGGIRFRPDPYGRDPRSVEQLFRDEVATMARRG
jgi:murein L,D-transpeptidase YcbB/YkuD